MAWPSRWRTWGLEGLTVASGIIFAGGVVVDNRSVTRVGAIVLGVVSIAVGSAFGADWRGLASQRAFRQEKQPATDQQVRTSRVHGWLYALGGALLITAIVAF